MFISNNSARLCTVEFGSGFRVLVAHGGWTGSWELWTGPFSSLSKSWRTIAYDHRGSGATVAPAESISLASLVGDLFAVLDAYEIEKCVLAGESAGVAVVLLAALQQPERFEGLVLVDGAYHWPAQAGRNSFVTGLIEDYPAAIGRFVDTCVPESEPDCTAIRRWGRQILGRAEQAAAIRLYECFFDLDLRSEIHKIIQPALVLHGELDAIIPVSESQWLADNLPSGFLEVIPGAGHVPSVTRAQDVARAVNRFFLKHE